MSADGCVGLIEWWRDGGGEIIDDGWSEIVIF